MPPKVKFTKEEIVNAALNITRRRGAQAVTTRDIAAELGVSTRPIFTYFKSMDEVREEVRLAAQAVYERYAADGLRTRVPFFGVGMQHIRFAREEPELYRLLFLRSDERGGALAAMRRLQEQVLPSIERIYRMDAATAEHYFRDMWLVGHSLSTLIVTGECPYDDAQIAQILTGFSLSLCRACKEVDGFVAGTFDRDAAFRAAIGEEK